jgi:hypothetical protein
MACYRDNLAFFYCSQTLYSNCLKDLLFTGIILCKYKKMQWDVKPADTCLYFSFELGYFKIRVRGV